MKERFFLFLGALIIGSTATGCADKCTNSSKIDEAEKKFSVLLRDIAGLESKSFNDIGCAVISRNRECASRQSIFDGGAAAYDFLNGEQVRVEKAYFAVNTDVKTPAGFGILAFKRKAEAEKFCAGHGKGKVVKWFELVDEKLK